MKKTDVKCAGKICPFLCNIVHTTYILHNIAAMNCKVMRLQQASSYFVMYLSGGKWDRNYCEALKAFVFKGSPLTAAHLSSS